MIATIAVSELWSGLRDAGMAEVMLYLPDGSASRCHWDDTAIVAGQRIALLADLERGIVRIIPVDSCVGVGIAAPKGTDPVGYRGVIRERLLGSTGRAARDPVVIDVDSPPRG